MKHKDFLKILDSVKQDVTSKNRNSDILVIDSLNTFLRCFTTVNILNARGHHIGGLTGFLRSMGAAIKLIKPTRVILVFDGLGGSDSKKNLYPDYKGNRKTKRVTNWDSFESRDEEDNSMKSQLARLIDYLECLPLDIIIVDKVEADDVMAFISNDMASKDTHITFMSTDQDFLQLISENVSVYIPNRKKIYTPEKLKEEFFVYPVNFLTKKVLMGDSSDNLPGVYGLGEKKLAKLFPELQEDKLFDIEDVYKKCELNIDILLHQRILNFKKQLNINKQLMNLHEPNISDNIADEINTIVGQKATHLNMSMFNKFFDDDLLEKSFKNVDPWLAECFRDLNIYSKK